MSKVNIELIDVNVGYYFAKKEFGSRYGVDWMWHNNDVGLLYDQSAIDRLTAERDAAVADAASLRERMLVLEVQRDQFHSDAFQSENARRKDEKDARRYRWLRDPNNYPDTDDFDSYWSDILGECCDAQSFDYAIDLAMKEQEQGK